MTTALHQQHEAHKARLARFDLAALKPSAPRAPLPRPKPITPAKWIDQQKAKYWFKIVDEIDGEGRPSIRRIQAAAGKHFGISYNELCSKRRKAASVFARQVAMYVCRIETQRSLPEIGRKFGGRDHTTALHAINKIDRNLPRYQADIDAIRAALA